MKHIIEANVTKTRNEYVKTWKVSKHNTALIDYVASFRTFDREKIESNDIINEIKNQAIHTINTINRDWNNRFNKHAQAASTEINTINTCTLAQANDLNNISA